VSILVQYRLSTLVQFVPVLKVVHSPRCGSRFRGLFTVTLVKSVNASCCVDQFLLAGKKRVTCGADFHMQVALPRGAGLKRLTAGAGNGYLVIGGMNFWLHYSLVPS
jgi:hypothetical protein